jgi:hypothetical protein
MCLLKVLELNFGNSSPYIVANLAKKLLSVLILINFGCGDSQVIRKV